MTRSPKGMGNSVYKVEYWSTKSPDCSGSTCCIITEGPYATKSAAKGRLTNRQNYSYEGRVLELKGEWVEA